MATSALIIIAVMLGFALAGLFAWVVYQLLPEKVTLLDRTIVKKYRGKTQQMSLTSLSEIKFHYHAVVGFIGVWEFIDASASSLTVDDAAKGMKELKAALEQVLPGFSSADFERKFREGDVEDSIDVWKAA